MIKKCLKRLNVEYGNCFNSKTLYQNQTLYASGVYTAKILVKAKRRMGIRSSSDKVENQTKIAGLKVPNCFMA